MLTIPDSIRKDFAAVPKTGVTQVFFPPLHMLYSFFMFFLIGNTLPTTNIAPETLGLEDEFPFGAR